MSKKAIWIGGGAVVLGAVFVGLPSLTGSMTESRLPQIIKKVSDSPSISAEVVSFERGYWASKAVTRWSIEGSDGDNLEILVDHQIDQVPNLNGLVTIRSVPRFSAEAKADLDHFFEGRDPVLAVSHAGPFGIDTTISSPSFTRPAKDDPEAKVTWKGATIEVNTDASATTGSMHMDAPGLKMEKPGETFELVSFTSEGTFDEVSGVPITPEMVANVQSISFGPMAVKGISWHQQEREKGGLFEVDATIKVDAVDAPGQSYSDARYVFSGSNIDARSIYDFMEQLQTVSAQADSDAAEAQSAAAAFDMFAKILQASPVLAVKEFHVDGPDGAIDAAVETSFDGAAGPVQLDNIPALVARAKIDGSLKLPKALARKLASQFAAERARMMVLGPNPESAPTQEQIAQMMQAQQQLTDQLLGQLVASNIAVEEAEHYKTAFVLDDGHLQMNGTNADHLLGPFAAQE